jgi:universal stress protein E
LSGARLREEDTVKALKIRSILVASDLHESSDAVIRGAGELAARHGAQLHVVHAVEFATVPYSAISASPQYQRQTDEARLALHEQLERTLPAGTQPTSQKVRVEDAPKAILERARETNADLIMIGPARPRAFRGTILGNTADHIVHAATVPVLVLRDSSALRPGRVVVPFDLGDPARGALDLGLQWAAGSADAADDDADATTPEVSVLYVIPQRYAGTDPPFDQMVVLPQLQLEVDDARQRTGLRSEVATVIDVTWGDAAAEEIVRYAEARRPELLVLGTHGYGAFGRAFIGSVTSRVVRSATCPMLLVPPSMWEVAAAGSR